MNKSLLTLLPTLLLTLSLVACGGLAEPGPGMGGKGDSFSDDGEVVFSCHEASCEAQCQGTLEAYANSPSTCVRVPHEGPGCNTATRSTAGLRRDDADDTNTARGDSHPKGDTAQMPYCTCWCTRNSDTPIYTRMEQDARARRNSTGSNDSTEGPSALGQGRRSR